MYDSDNDDGNAYDNDDDAEEDALFSSNVFQPQVTLKEEYVEMDSARYPWNFLETAGYYTLIGSTLLDVNDQQSTLVLILFYVSGIQTKPFLNEQFVIFASFLTTLK
jgi:hypothetical protein